MFKNKLKIATVIFILVVSIILRLHNYETYPQRGATSDEYTYSFLGMSLIKNHIPISWSAFPVYKNRYDLTIRSLYFPIVYPYFDHPPLNGFLTGGLSLLMGQDTFEKVDLKTIRLVPIVLSFVSSIILFFLSLRLFNYKTALWALLIYSTTTIFVISGRIALSENLLTPLFLGSIYLFLLWSKNISYKKAIMLGILSGLSFWTKELGIVVFFTLFYLFKSERIQLKPFLIFVIVSLSIISLYALYGAYYDWNLFVKIWSLQADREIGPQTLYMLLNNPILVNKPYADGWYFFGFLALFFALLDYKKNKFVMVPAFFYFFLLLFSLTRHGEMGWYVIPLFPFMVIASARFLIEGIEKKSWVIFTFLLFVGFYELAFLFEENFGLVPMQFRMFLVVTFAPFIILQMFDKDVLFRKLANIWFYLMILGNIVLTYSYVHPS